MKNERVERIKQALRQPQIVPSVERKSFIAHDGPLCHKCIKDNFRAVVNDARMNVGPWNVKVVTLQEGEYWCVDCNKKIEISFAACTTN